MESEMIECILSQMVGAAYPPGQPVAQKSGRLVRRWLVRFTAPVDATRASTLATRLTSSAYQKLQSAYATSVPAAALEASTPSVSIAVFDERYAMVMTEFPEPGIAVGDAAAICQIGVLQDLDREWPIEELQGFPRRLWFFLRCLMRNGS
jgi:hypothetical protein